VGERAGRKRGQMGDRIRKGRENRRLKLRLDSYRITEGRENRRRKLILDGSSLASTILISVTLVSS
jgi:hypothetical protein